MNTMKQKISILFFLASITLSTLQFAAATHYQMVSTYLPETKKISRLSKEVDISNACNVAKAYFTDQIKRAKDGSQKRSLLEKEKELIEACAVLGDSRKRTAYHEQLDKQSLGAAVKESKELKRIKSGASPYETVSNGLRVIGLSSISLHKKSTPAEVSSACNKLKNGIINELRKAKAGSQERELWLANQSTVNSVCSILENPRSRKEYDERGAEFQLEEQERLELEAARVKSLTMGAKVFTDKQREIADRRRQRRKDLRPKPGDPDYVGGMEGYAKQMFNEQKETGVILLGDLAGDILKDIEIPPQSTKIFNTNLALKDMAFVSAPIGMNITTGIGFSGTAQINNVDVKVTIYILRDRYKKNLYSIGIELPEHYKISDMFPNFKKLDVLTLPTMKLVASTASYLDPEGYQVEVGFNFIASLSLEGPLRALGELRKKASKYDFIVVDTAPIYLQGVIPSGVSAKFKAIVPIRLGIDFTKAKKVPSEFSRIINKITTDDFIMGAVFRPEEQSFNVQSGIQLVLGSQKTPLRIQALGGIDILTGKINVAGKIPDMLEMGIIAIGDVSIELYWDPAVESVLAMFGVPVSGIALGGRIDLGKPGEARASLMAKGKISLETKKLADFVLELEGRNIQFAEIVSLVTKMAARSGLKNVVIPADKIPTITIHRVYGKMAPWDTVIAGQPIPAGFQLALDMQLFDKKFGFDVTIRHKDLIFSGFGYMPEIVFKKENKKIFSLAGTTPGGGPSVFCTVNVKKPLDSMFGISAILDIPPIALKSSINLQASGKSFMADLETDFLGFTTVFGINIPAQAEFDEKVAITQKKEAIEIAQRNVDKKQELLNSVKSIDTKNKEQSFQETTARMITAAQKELNEAQQNLKNQQAISTKRRSRWQDMFIKFGFKGDFQKFLSTQAVPVIKRLQKAAATKLAQVDKKIGELSGELEKLRKRQVQAQQSAGSATQREIKKTQDTIQRINVKIADLKKECNQAPAKQKVPVCIKTTAQITAQGTALAAQETYLRGLLKPGKQVIKTSLDIVNQINKGVQIATTAISEAKIFQKAAHTVIGSFAKALEFIGKGFDIFKVTEAIGEVNAQELAEGKMPKLLSLQVEINIPELDTISISLYYLQFDFKDPKGSVADIVLKLLKGIKIGEPKSNTEFTVGGLV